MRSFNTCSALWCVIVMIRLVTSIGCPIFKSWRWSCRWGVRIIPITSRVSWSTTRRMVIIDSIINGYRTPIRTPILKMTIWILTWNDRIKIKTLVLSDYRLLYSLSRYEFGRWVFFQTSTWKLFYSLVFYGFENYCRGCARDWKLWVQKRKFH